MLYVEYLQDVSITPLVSIYYVKASNANHDHSEQNSTQDTSAKETEDSLQDTDNSPCRISIACAQHRMSRYELVTRGPRWMSTSNAFAALWARMEHNIFSYAESYVSIRLDMSHPLRFRLTLFILHNQSLGGCRTKWNTGGNVGRIGMLCETILSLQWHSAFRGGHECWRVRAQHRTITGFFLQ